MLTVRSLSRLMRIFACLQIKQPTDATGIAVYSSTGCTVRDLTLYSAAGFGFYDGTATGSNSYMCAPHSVRIMPQLCFIVVFLIFQAKWHVLLHHRSMYSSKDIVACAWFAMICSDTKSGVCMAAH